MIRTFAIAAMFALALPALAVAEDHGDHHDDHKGPPQHQGGPNPQFKQGNPQFKQGNPQFKPGPMSGPMHPPGPPGPGGQFSWHGHNFNRVHGNPFIYPPGWAYRRWAVGALLPPLFLARSYWYADWAGLGLAPPPPGFQWVRYGPDLLLVDVTTGQVSEVIPDVFY